MDRLVSTSTIAPAPERDGRSTAQLLTELQSVVGKLAAQLRAPAAVPGLHLDPQVCHRLEAVTGLGTTETASRLLAAVERLASLRFGDIRIEFTPGQLEEIAHRARKRGRSVESEMKAVVDRIQDELFYKGG